MANKENQSKTETRRIYICIQRRWQEVPEEVYQEHIRFHDTYRPECRTVASAAVLAINGGSAMPTA